MKNKMAPYILVTILGLTIVAAGIVLLVKIPDADGILGTLPFICIGIGAGAFGGGFSGALKCNLARKNLEAYKQAEIEQKDERNIAIDNRAKGKAYDLMLIVFAAQMIAFALVQAPLYVVLPLVTAYLFVVFVRFYYVSKYQKEM